MIYIIKQEGLYQNKVNSSLVFTCNCKMGYYLGEWDKKVSLLCPMLCHPVSRVIEHGGWGAGTNIRTPFRSDITPCFFLIENIDFCCFNRD